jgi:FkbH-like protein
VSAILSDPQPAAHPAAEGLFTRVRRQLNDRYVAWQMARAIRTQRRERYRVAFRCFAAAARAGDPEAQYRLGLAHARGEGVIRHPPDAVRWYRRAAEQGHLEAQFQLSLIFLHGQPGAGEDWYRAAVACDRQAAEWNRDIWFSAGMSVPSDYVEALRWSRLAAEQGRAEAQANLGSLYLRGLGCAQDDAAAHHWYELAAAQGNAEGEYGLGMIYANGLGVAVDLAAAARFYALAAEKNNDAAQTALGLMYVAGQGVERDPCRAAALFRQAAGQGNARARCNLGLLQLRGEGLARDEAAAEASFRDAARLGHAPAMLRLAQICVSRRSTTAEMAEAVLWYKAAAAAGSAEAQFILGRLHAEGEGVPQQWSEAVRWFESAAEQGHAAARLSLALLYSQGAGVPRDPAKALEWYARAAAQGAEVRLAQLYVVGDDAASDQQGAARRRGRGESEAETALALLYLRGDGVPRDIARAEALLRRAAERGHGPASLELGHLYSGGYGTRARESEALDWYRAAAATGQAEAQLLVAHQLLNGIGCAADAAAAAHCLRQAARQGDARAQFQLGALHYQGQGVERDPAAAAKWYRLAAEQGDRFAQHNLAEMLLAGDGVEPDPEQAVAWYRRAAEQGLSASETALGDLHARGCGAECDPEAAPRLDEAAARHGSDDVPSKPTELAQEQEFTADILGSAPVAPAASPADDPPPDRAISPPPIPAGEPVRLVIWDLDTTSAEEAVGEGGFHGYSRETRDLIITLARRGIMSSICSKDDPPSVRDILQECGIWEYIIFPSIDPGAKGERVVAIIAAAELLPSTVLFIDDNPMNRADVAALVPGIQTADSAIAPRILTDPRFEGIGDPELTRLARYRLLQRSAALRSATGDREAFLRASHIHVIIDSDVSAHIDRAIELITNATALRFTERQLPDDVSAARQQIRGEISPYWVHTGLIRVIDDYGDYGYCGYYWMVGRQLLDYSFSQYVCGMGIESWLYQGLGSPPIVWATAASAELTQPGTADWITLLAKEGGEGKEPARFVPEVRLRGGGDLDALAHYFRLVSGMVCLETNRYRAPLFLQQDSSAFLEPALGPAPPGFYDAARRLGYVEEDFASAFLSPAPPGSILVYSGWGDVQLTVYRHCTMDFTVPVNVDIYEDLTTITDEALAEAFARLSVDEAQKAEIREIVDALRADYTCQARLPIDRATGILRRLFGRIPEGARLFVILPYEWVKWEGALLPRQCAIEYNNAVRELARDFGSVTVMSMNDAVASAGDVQVECDTFERMVYFRMYERIMTELGAA